MNVLLAPLLYVMNEMDAFYCFKRMIVYIIPTYVKKSPDVLKSEFGMKGSKKNVFY